MGIIRILLIADTHLGFDLLFRPRTFTLHTDQGSLALAPATMNINASRIDYSYYPSRRQKIHKS